MSEIRAPLILRLRLHYAQDERGRKIHTSFLHEPYPFPHFTVYPFPLFFAAPFDYITTTLRATSPFSSAVIAVFTSSSEYVRETSSSIFSFFFM